MKKNRFLIFVFLFTGVFLFQYSSVSAYKFYARFFPGKGGYLKYDVTSEFSDTKYQGVREIDSDQDTNLTNHYVRDNCTFFGWVAERNNGATWYCKEGEASDCGSENNYAIYGSNSNRKYETGEAGKNAGYHAVWDCDGIKVYPAELGETYSYYDVQYQDESGLGVNPGKYLGEQSVIIGQDNKLMQYNVESFEGWNVYISKGSQKIWYCGNGKTTSEQGECLVKYVAKNKTSQAGNNGDYVVYVANVENYKPKYTILYLTYEDDEIHYFSDCSGASDCAYDEVEYDTDVVLDDSVFQREGQIINGWYIYIYNVQDSSFQCFDSGRSLAGASLFSSAEDYKEKFSKENCNSPVPTGKFYKLNIPFDSEFYRQVFIWSQYYNIKNYTGNDNYVIYAQAIWTYGESEHTTGYTDEDICKQKGNIWIKKGDSGYCSIDGLLYLKCGDIYGFPEIIPKISSYFVTLLKTVAPIVLIIFSVISLVKAVSAGKEDDIKKAQTSFVKKLIIGGIIFFVVTIVQFIMLKVADSSEKDNLSKCLSCFLNGTDDKHCNSIFYKYRGESGEIEYKNISK